MSEPETTLDDFLKKYGKKAATLHDVHDAFDVLFKLMSEMNERNKARNQRLDALEAKVKELESKPLLKYAGVWQSGKTYGEGRLVTHGGSLWLATETTADTPGNDGSGYRLIVKRGAA